MALEKWNEYPKEYDVIKRDIFFDEFRSNLVAVIKDYALLGVNNEPALIASANTLFTDTVVPSRKDWQIITNILEELSLNKEFSTMRRNFFDDAEDSLGITDLSHIRSFLDAIQEIDPQSVGLNLTVPVPNRTEINKPTLSSTDNYKGNIKISWTLNSNSLAIKNATVTGLRSVSEDVDRYVLSLKAGTGNWTKTFNASEEIIYNLPLTWNSWYKPGELSKAQLSATLQVFDKRGNQSVVTQSKGYSANTVIQTAISSYRVEYKLDKGNWIFLTNTPNLNWIWTNLPKKNGTYYFRVNGTDANKVQTEWAYSDGKYLSYLPDPPEKPNPTYTSTSKTITISWPACARAEYYEVYNWSTTKKAIEMSVNGNVYYKKVMANQTRSVTLYNFSSDSNHGISVKAVNAGGEAIGYVSAKTKANPLLKKSYSTENSRVWRGSYKFLNSWGGLSHHAGKVWRDEKDVIYQGEWKEVNLGGWRQRGGNGSYYMAYDGNTWGNNMSFLFFDYTKMRNELRGKKISKVTISINRSTAGAHGFAQATPLYIYNHNRDNNTSTTTGNAFTLFRADNKAAVGKNNQKAAANVRFDRGETERISNDWTKKLITNIIDGSMRGLGIVKYYGDYLNTNATYSDTAYMRLSGKVKIDIEYYNE